jgi:Gas vesicle synthesis protein GvpL/GvpF
LGVYVYCIVPVKHRPALDLVGVGGAAVSAGVVGRIGVLFSESPARPEPSIERIREHNRVVEAAVSVKVTPVPVRFGQWLASWEALQQHVLERAGWYAAALYRFAGCLEFGIRVLDPDQHPARILPTPEGTTGRQYMVALREQYRARESAEPALDELRDRIHERFATLVRAEQFETPETSHGKTAVVHLVEHAKFDNYRVAVQELRAQFTSLRFLSSGPWPPYSFAAARG